MARSAWKIDVCLVESLFSCLAVFAVLVLFSMYLLKSGRRPSQEEIAAQRKGMMIAWGPPAACHAGHAESSECLRHGLVPSGCCHAGHFDGPVTMQLPWGEEP